MLYTYNKAKPKQCAMHLEAIQVVKYTTEQINLKLDQTNILRNSRKLELWLF